MPPPAGHVPWSPGSGAPPGRSASGCARRRRHPDCGRCAMPEARVIPLRPDDDEPHVLPPLPPGWDQQLLGGLEFLRRRLTGEYETDEFGFDADLTDHLLLPALRPLYSRWFRVAATGLDHVPAEGGALVVANHSGTLP